MKQIIITLLLALVSLTGQAQNANPMGLYKLSEIIHQDGKHVEASFKQYKYCQKEFSLMLNHDAILFPGDPFSFTISNPDGKPLLFTGELSKTELPTAPSPCVGSTTAALSTSICFPIRQTSTRHTSW